MRKLLDLLIYRSPYAALWLGTGAVLMFVLFFISADVILPATLPQDFTSQAELLGQVLLMTLVPAYVLGLLVIAQRRSMRNARKMYSTGIIDADPEQWLRPVPAGKLLAGATAGLLYAITANLPHEWLVRLSQLDFQEQSIIVGQSLLWMITGFSLAFRFNTAALFDQQGKAAPVDIYNNTQLEPFARNGLDDVLLITGALALTALQALDAQFRVGNYLAAIIIALPAAIYLQFRPMLSVHRRLAQQKAEFLQRVNRQIAEQANASGPCPELEPLLQHRDRLRKAYTWPVDLGMIYRLLLYVVIPPLAWFGAALMENAVDGVLG